MSNLPARTSDRDERRVPCSRHTELDFTADRVELTARQPDDIAERGGVGFAFLAAGMTGGLAFLFVSGAAVDVTFGILCMLAGVFAAMHQWTRPPVERRLTVSAEGVTDLSNEGDGLEREQFDTSEIRDVVMRPIKSDRGDMYRVELQLLADDKGCGTYPIYDTTDWQEAKELAGEIQKKIDG